MKEQIPGLLFFVLNVVFISLIQSVLLFAIAAPVYPLLLSIQFEKDLSIADMVFVGIQLGLVALEWTSDQQQWSRCRPV